MKCADCRFFEEERNECRFGPPQFVTYPDFGGYWPRVSKTSWCGRFESVNRTATRVLVGEPYLQELSHGV